jgi:hypothetical protein
VFSLVLSICIHKFLASVPKRHDFVLIFVIRPRVSHRLMILDLLRDYIDYVLRPYIMLECQQNDKTLTMFVPTTYSSIQSTTRRNYSFHFFSTGIKHLHDTFLRITHFQPVFAFHQFHVSLLQSQSHVVSQLGLNLAHTSPLKGHTTPFLQSFVPSFPSSFATKANIKPRPKPRQEPRDQ